MAELELMPIFQPKEERAKTLLLNILGLATGDLTHAEETRKDFVYAAAFELLEIIREGNSIDEHLQWLVYSETENWQNGYDAYKSEVLATEESRCRKLAKHIYSSIHNPKTNEKARETLNRWVEEMVSGGLETYPLPVIEAFICKPENDGYIAQFKEFLGEK